MKRIVQGSVKQLPTLPMVILGPILALLAFRLCRNYLLPLDRYVMM